MTRIWRQWPVVAPLLLLLTSWPRPVAAQPPWDEGGGPPGREKLELLRMWRLIDHLELDEEQAAKVFPVFRRHREAREALAAERRETLTTLQQKLAEGADDEDLLQAIGAARAVEARMRDAEATFQTELAQLLSVQQQARLLLFDATFRSELRDMVRRIRGGPPAEAPRRQGERPGPWSE